MSQWDRVNNRVREMEGKRDREGEGQRVQGRELWREGAKEKKKCMSDIQLAVTGDMTSGWPRGGEGVGGQRRCHALLPPPF